MVFAFVVNECGAIDGTVNGLEGSRLSERCWDRCARHLCLGVNVSQPGLIGQVESFGLDKHGVCGLIGFGGIWMMLCQILWRGWVCVGTIGLYLGSRFACWYNGLVVELGRFRHGSGVWAVGEHQVLITHSARVPRRIVCKLLVGFVAMNNCRIGEAAVPGPPVWALGVCNPSGLGYKGHLLDPQVDVWTVCETHLSAGSFRQFVATLRVDQSPFKWCVPGAHVPCRSTTSDVGAWSGVAVISKWPTRALLCDWPIALWSSSRLCCTATFVHGLWVTGTTCYGTPTGPTHPRARETTNCLIQAAVDRISQAHGPRFVAGDWNHDLCDIQAVSGLLALGFVELQDLWYERSGIHPCATCKQKTRRDYCFLSPELQSIFHSCTVDHHAWPDHSALIAHFCGGQQEMIRSPWPQPLPIDWSRLGSRSDGKFVDFSSPCDPQQAFCSLWQDVEKVAQECASAQRKPLGAGQLGRGQHVKPKVVRSMPSPIAHGRCGDVQPGYFGSSWIHARMFRQLRRLQSYVRLARGSFLTSHHWLHADALWTSILKAPGFKPSFAQWWIDNVDAIGLPATVPVCPPTYAVASLIYNMLESKTRELEKQLAKQMSYQAKLKKGTGMKQVYASVRRDPPVPVESLVMHRSAVVSVVDVADCAVEFDQCTEWLEDAPFVAQGRQLSPIFVTPDKLWLESIEGLVPGVSVVQHQGVGDLHTLFGAFVAQWTSRWGRHCNVPSSQWDDIIAFAKCHLRPLSVPPLEWTPQLLKATVSGKKKSAAIGPDGISRMDLCHLRSPHVDSVLSMFRRAERDGQWPPQPLIGAVRSLAKTEHPCGANDYRPITVLGMLYRTWGTCHAQYWIRKLDVQFDPLMFGSRCGCRAAHLWRYVLDLIDGDRFQESSTAGLVLDLTKAFNTLPRYPTLAVAKLLGVAEPTLLGWAGALGTLQRRFVIRGSYSPAVESSCGFPEGDALSCLAMICVDQIFHKWMVAGSVRCTPLSYVDNWELVFADSDNVKSIMDRALDFAASWDLTIDAGKTYSWATSKMARRTLRAEGFRVVGDTRDLGAHVSYGSMIRNGTLQQRIQGLSDFWAKLAGSRGSVFQKVRAIKTAAWPRALHAVSAVVVGRKHWEFLRTAYMKALRFQKPGSSPWIQMIIDGFCVDPQQYAIWNTILDFRSLGSSSLQLATLNSVISEGSRVAKASVSEVLCHRLHQIGWALSEDGFAQDRFGGFDLARGCLQAIMIRFQIAWQSLVSCKVAHRMDFANFDSVNLVETRKDMKRHPLPDQGALRAVLNGTTFTNQHAYHWSSNGSCSCPECGALDSLHHKYWECQFVDDLIGLVPIDVRELIDVLPSCVADRGWTLRPSLYLVWSQMLLSIPMEVRFCVPPVLPDILDLFTDGSCFWGHIPDFRIASWAVCLGLGSDVGNLAASFSVIASQPLSGLVQSAFRAELSAVAYALRFARLQSRPCRIWTDCASVLTKYHQFVSGCKRWSINGSHSDLWHLVLDEVECIGQENVIMAKVNAHVDASRTDTDIEAWLSKGNNSADCAARAANTDRGHSFWQLWARYSDEVSRANYVGSTVRDHIVQVNARWKQRKGTEGATPVVHATKQAKQHLTMWRPPLSDGPVAVRFQRLFGVKMLQTVQRWWSDIIDRSDGAQVVWVSYAQLYIDWQLNCGHAGVLKIKGGWVDANESTGYVPHHYSFRSRCKWFRLMIQQYGRDADFQFARATVRPASSWLACHIGCASLPVRSIRLDRVESWLAKHLQQPILGLGVGMDGLPPAWG